MVKFGEWREVGVLWELVEGIEGEFVELVGEKVVEGEIVEGGVVEGEDFVVLVGEYVVDLVVVVFGEG